MHPDREALERLQLERLNALLAAVWEGNSFYANKLNGTPRSYTSLADFRGAVPVTEKHELVADQNAHPPFGTNLTYPIERYSRFCQTSGTTARPMRWLDTPETWSWMLDCWTRVLLASGVTPTDRLFFPFSFGPFLGLWAAFDAAARLGCLAIPGGGMRSSARLRMILDNGVTALCATPTYTIHLAETAHAEGIDLTASQVRRIIVAGEPGGSIPVTRARIEQLWPGARVYDHHGMTEIGPVSYECPARRGVLHIIEQAYLPEVVDPETLQPIAPGELGELLLTNLGRTGSPLLRYRTRDFVRRGAAEPCACGSFEMALEGGILGRTDDMVVIRGVNIYPSAVEEIVRAEPEVAEFRVEVCDGDALSELRIQVEPMPATQDPAALAARLQEALRAAFALRIAVEAVSPDALPRFELKAKRWVKA
ncbi:MAG: AMP-binding protein [Bryobacterales bacterium]